MGSSLGDSPQVRTHPRTEEEENVEEEEEGKEEVGRRCQKKIEEGGRADIPVRHRAESRGAELPFAASSCSSAS